MLIASVPARCILFTFKYVRFVRFCETAMFIQRVKVSLYIVVLNIAVYVFSLFI